MWWQIINNRDRALVVSGAEGGGGGGKGGTTNKPQGNQPQGKQCSKGGMQSRSNNPELNSNLATGSLVGLTLFAVTAVVTVVAAPEAPVIGGLALMDALAGEPVATWYIVGGSAGAYGAILGGAAGYLLTDSQPSKCP
jgi:hypothetical protein